MNGYESIEKDNIDEDIDYLVVLRRFDLIKKIGITMVVMLILMVIIIFIVKSAIN